MKRYDQNAFIFICMLCGLALLVGCSSSRHSATVTAIATRDTINTRILVDSVAAAVDGHAHIRDTVSRSDRNTGTLTVERDTAGRPTRYIWDTSAFMQGSAWSRLDFDSQIDGRFMALDTNATATKAEDIEKTERVDTKIGVPLEDYIGTALVAFVILYLLYILIEKLWRNRNR